VKTAWLTYAWADNEFRDVDFVAGELVSSGVNVKLDRWNLSAGKRLWEQIESFITEPSLSDGWILYATQTSLASEPCREEYAYALSRALDKRGGAFPVIGLFPGPIEQTLIPAGIRTRLYVTLTDPQWKERIKTALDGLPIGMASESLHPFSLRVHEVGKFFQIEVRPRAGVWAPVIVGVPIGEQTNCDPMVLISPSGTPSRGGMTLRRPDRPSSDGAWWIMEVDGQATPISSDFVQVARLPSKLVFGARSGPQFRWSFETVVPFSA